MTHLHNQNMLKQPRAKDIGDLTTNAKGNGVGAQSRNANEQQMYQTMLTHTFESSTSEYH